MELDTERSNRMFNLFMIGFIIAFVAGCVVGAFASWLAFQI